jgi:hypothetical protein
MFRATRQMSTYTPDEATTSVAPLLQFFELVHVGDTIQSMMQVYFDKDLAKYVDKTDFLNGVMREKKRFESVLDDAVAAGLNAGIEVLMNQVSGPCPHLSLANSRWNTSFKSKPVPGNITLSRVLQWNWVPLKVVERLSHV